MFSIGSFSSISLATVTPSLVIAGEPNFFVDDYVTAFGAKGHLHCIGQGVNTFAQAFAGGCVELNNFCHFVVVFFVCGYGMD